jgi:phosphate:Na+ symporter
MPLLLAFLTSASGWTQVFTDEAEFLAAAGELSIEGFESTPDGTTRTLIAFDNFGVSSVDLSVSSDGPIEGNQSLFWAPMSPPAAGTTLVFSFERPVTAFGMTLFDLPETESGGALTFKNGADASEVIESGHSSAGSEVFFGFISETAFDEATIVSTLGGGRLGIDNIRLTAPQGESYLAIKIILEVLGGLGIFLLGMRNMSEGLQAIAGPKLKKMINLATGNRFVACGMGTLVTCIVQSSSITTVMVIGLVNVNIMNLTQAIGVIMGANIGTTVTGWVLVLEIGRFGLPILGAAAMVYLFTRRDRLRFISMCVMGVGMIFFGLELMKNGFKPLREMDEFVKWFAAFSPHTYFGVLKCCLAGAVLTAIVQSSSATLGITISLATTGVIDFPTAAALVLGENIGTTITALLASLGGSINARRASYAHVLFNITGVIWITAIFGTYIGMVTRSVTAIYGGDPSTMVFEGGEETFPFITAGIAVTHTGFNVVNVLLFLPFTGKLAQGLSRLVPEEGEAGPPILTHFDIRMLDTPILAIEQSRKEVLAMSDGVINMLEWLRPQLESSTQDEEIEDKIFHREEVLDIVQKEINEFVSHILSGSVPYEVLEEGRQQLRMADEYESISDYIVTALKLAIKLKKDGLAISEDELKAILNLHDHVVAYVELVNDAVRGEQREVIAKARTQGDAITHLMKQYRSDHLDRVGSENASPFESLAITDMLNAYRRIKDHALNIAETVSGEK